MRGATQDLRRKDRGNWEIVSGEEESFININQYLLA
jgi:hypothetical protein